MKPNRHSKIPRDLSDEGAATLVQFLRKLTRDSEMQCAVQIRRHELALRGLYDPDQPWKDPNEPF
jgi:hypothetical protein